MFVDHASCKEPREGTFGQVLGQPCGLTNLSRRQPVRMLAEQGDNDATPLLHLGVNSPAVGRRRGCRTLLTLLHPMLDPSRACLAHLVQLSSLCHAPSLHLWYYKYNILL